MLLIDNRRRVAEALAHKLNGEGFVAVPAEGVRQALDVASCLRFSVLVCMPGQLEEQVEVMRELHARYGTRGIAVTESALSPEEQQRARAAGFEHYLRAPVRYEKLVEAIRALKQQNPGS